MILTLTDRSMVTKDNRAALPSPYPRPRLTSAIMCTSCKPSSYPYRQYQGFTTNAQTLNSPPLCLADASIEVHPS